MAGAVAFVVVALYAFLLYAILVGVWAVTRGQDRVIGYCLIAVAIITQIGVTIALLVPIR